MALYPCSADGARYRGPSQAMYPAVVHGTDSVRAHLRLCPSHFQEKLDYCRKYLEEVVYDSPAPSQEQLPVCVCCGSDVADNRLVFVTAYPSGQQETQFYGHVCLDCVPKLSLQLLIRY